MNCNSLDKKYQQYFNDVEEYWYRNYTPSIGDVIFDIGAGRGEDSIPFSCHVGNEGKVISIEASPRSFEYLKYECVSNNISNIILLNMAVTDFRKDIYIEDNSNWITNTLSKENGIKISGDTLDSICVKLDINKINFLKMNIEGAELEAIKGMNNSIKFIEKICICSHNFRADRGEGEQYRSRDNVLEFLKSNGFSIFRRLDDPRDFVQEHIFGER